MAPDTGDVVDTATEASLSRDHRKMLKSRAPDAMEEPSGWMAIASMRPEWPVNRASSYSCGGTGIFSRLYVASMGAYTDASIANACRNRAMSVHGCCGGSW